MARIQHTRPPENGAERRAQFMRQHGQELVFHTIGTFSIGFRPAFRLLQLLAAGDVVIDFQDASGFALVITARVQREATWMRTPSRRVWMRSPDHRPSRCTVARISSSGCG